MHSVTITGDNLKVTQNTAVDVTTGTGTVEFQGELYGPDGFSMESSEYGGFKILDVERLRDEYVNSGDKYKMLAAGQFPMYFYMQLQGRHYNSQQALNVFRDHSLHAPLTLAAGSGNPYYEQASIYELDGFRTDWLGNRFPIYRWVDPAPTDHQLVVRGSDGFLQTVMNGDHIAFTDQPKNPDRYYKHLTKVRGYLLFLFSELPEQLEANSKIGDKV